MSLIPLRFESFGYDWLHDLRYSSLPVSFTSGVQIAAKLYVTSDKVDDIEIFTDVYMDTRTRCPQPPVDPSVLRVKQALLDKICNFFDDDDDDKRSQHLCSNLKATCTLQETTNPVVVPVLLPEEQLLQITKHKTAKAIWDALKTRHIGEERVQQARLQTLKSDFEMLHMKEDETIDTFTGKLTTLVNKAASLGHTIEDYVVVRKLLNAVPDKFLQIIASIEQYSYLDEMSVDEAIGRLKTFEERIKSKKKISVDSQESLMFTRHEGQRKPFRKCGRFNQSRGQEQDKNDYKREERASFEDTRDKSQVTCYRCHKLGHYAYECPNKRKNQIRGESNLIEEDLEPTLLMATITKKK
ncbi:zinc finger, CCHC-type containing protein [Tanacetum coccineum]